MLFDVRIPTIILNTNYVYHFNQKMTLKLLLYNVNTLKTTL